ncbi:RdRp [hymenopteran rhabdo-related virus 24]|uniref:Replicase n=1 Tax=hymenopteran rhabdo-related virus 24 TaxID=2847805 RepID=A0A7U3NVF1_9RHAB|nr:RdRp [hymenopteran rhabdo-related virus 24]QPB73983.1 RdRp [hymenopteran rhabdo-related virus 24]
MVQPSMYNRFRKNENPSRTKMQVLDELKGSSGGKTKPLLAVHLDAPIRDAKLKKIHTYIKNAIPPSFRDRGLYQEAINILHEGRTSWDSLSFGMYPFFQLMSSETSNNPAGIRCQSLTNFSYLIGITKNLVDNQIKMLPKNMSLFSTFPNVDRDKLMKSPPLQYYWKLKTSFEELVILTGVGPIRAKHIMEESPISVEEPISGIYKYQLTKNLFIIAGRDLVLLTDHKEIRWMGVREHLLMLADVCCQRFMVILASILADLNQTNHYPRVETLLQAFSWGDNILAEKGNLGYEIIGMWESLAIGFLLRESNDQYINCSAFINVMQKDFLEKGGTQYQFKDLESLFLQSMRQSISNGFQLFGLYRIWGHPTIDSAKGILKLRKLAGRPRPVNMEKINLIYQKFCEYFCRAYYRKNSTWPQCDVSQVPHFSYLKEKIQKNLPIDSNNPQYNPLDWHFIEFKKTFLIPKQFDLSELISDKAMSHSLPNLIENIIKSGSIGNAAERSVIIQWIQSELGDPEEFLKDIDLNGFGEDEVVVGVCPKERELKIIARLFGLLTFKKRMYVVLTESLIATYFLKYFPEITVLNNQTELLKKQLFATKGMGSKESAPKVIKIVVNIDFNKWNTNMREVETKLMFKAMDNLLGFSNLIQRTHDMFSKSTLYLADGTFCPKIRQGKLSPSPYTWRGHLGGIEGLRQKGWTLWTVIILKYAMERCNIQAQLMGQGDNQVLICYYPTSLGPDEIIRLHNGFLSFLESFISDLGPPLKREETWESTALFMYGKYPIYRECPQPLSLKKISRLMKCSNEGFPTIDSSLSSLSAGFFDSCWMDFSPIIPCVCYTFEVLNSLYLHIFRSLLPVNSLYQLAQKKNIFKIPNNMGGQQEIRLNSEVWQMLDNRYKLLWSIFFTPRQLGGYPITWLVEVLLRGFPDPLTLNISALRNLLHSNMSPELLEWQKQVIDNVLHPWPNPSASFDLLGEDPLSLNIIHPSTPGDQLKRLVFDLLVSPGLKKSKKFENFLEKVQPSQTTLATYLSQMVPKVNPRIMHEIISSTVTSRAMQVVQRINKTNTLTHLLIKSHEKDLTKRIVTSEVNFFLSVIFQISSNHPYPVMNCSTEISNFLRTSSWGLEITGVTVASPLEAFDIVPASDLECHSSHSRAEDGFVLLKSFNESNLPINEFPGPSLPYIGSETVQKVKGYGQTVSKMAAPILTRIAKLMTLIGWGTSRDSQMAMVLKELLGSITNISPALFEAKYGEVTGSVEHRFHDQVTSRGCFLPVLYNESTWLSLSTSTLTKYAKGSKNVNLSFQSVLILLESWYSINKNKTLCSGYHFHLFCTNCIQPVFEGLLDLPPPPEIKTIFPSYPGDSYFWVDLSDVDLVDEISYIPQPELIIDNSISQANEIFHELVARYVTNNYRKYVDEVESSGVSIQESQNLSISWIFKLNPELFLNYVVRLLFDYYCYHNLFSCGSLRILIQNFEHYLSRLPVIWFSIFYPLTLESKLITHFVSHGYLTPPAGVPPSLYQWNSSFRGMLLSFVMKNGIPKIQMKYHNLSTFPEFYPGWNHLINHCLLGSVSYLQLREAKVWLPTSLINSSKGCVSPKSLFVGNPHNAAHPRYWNSWGEILNCLMLTNWNITYSTPDFWAKMLPVFIADEPLTIPKKVLPVLGKLNDIWFELTHDKNAMGFSSVSIEIEHKPKTPLDPGYVSFMKPLGKSTTSIYKAVGLLDGLINGNYFYPTILVVGDGAGGFSIASKLLSPHSEIIYNSRIAPENVGPQGLPGFLPSDFYYYPALINDIKGIGTAIMGVSDISNPKWINQMEKFKPSIIISDAEFAFNDSQSVLNALINLLQLCACQETECLIFKFYLNESEICAIVCELLHHHYVNVAVYRSYYSNENGSEVYIVGRSLRSRVLPFDVKILGNTVLLAGAVSNKSLHSLIEHFQSYPRPFPLYIRKDLVSEFLERPADRPETLAFHSRLGVSTQGSYPWIMYETWSGVLDLGSFEDWKAKKQFLINKIKGSFLRSIMQQHLFYLGQLIHNPRSFQDWLRLYKTGILYIWLSRDRKWRSGISFIRSNQGTGYCKFRISKYVTKSAILHLIKMLARVKYFKIPHVSISVSLTNPLPLPPLLGRYPTKHPQDSRIPLEVLPASKGLCGNLFRFKHVPSPAIYVGSIGKSTKQLILLD